MDFIANHIGDIICLAYYPVLFLIWPTIEEVMLATLSEAIAYGVIKV